MAFRQKSYRKVSASAAFDQILKALEPHLTKGQFLLVEEKAQPEGSDSRFATFSDGTSYVRLSLNGKGQYFVLEGDLWPDRSPPSGDPVWVDFTLQQFDPVKGDEKWVAELIEDIIAAFKAFAQPGC